MDFYQSRAIFPPGRGGWEAALTDHRCPFGEVLTKTTLTMIIITMMTETDPSSFRYVWGYLTILC